jgi:sigma-E factor negative regulatory protein RseC
MMTALATVMDVQAQDGRYQISLSCEQKTSCGSCSSAKSCSTGVVSKVMGNKAHFWQLFTVHTVTTGQVVEIGFPEKSLLQSAALVYLLPLLFMMIGALIGNAVLVPWLGGGEPIVILSSLVFMAFGIGLARHFSHRLSARSADEVVLLRVLGQPIL